MVACSQTFIQCISELCFVQTRAHTQHTLLHALIQWILEMTRCETDRTKENYNSNDGKIYYSYFRILCQRGFAHCWRRDHLLSKHACSELALPRVSSQLHCSEMTDKLNKFWLSLILFVIRYRLHLHLWLRLNVPPLPPPPAPTLRPSVLFRQRVEWKYTNGHLCVRACVCFVPTHACSVQQTHDALLNDKY